MINLLPSDMRQNYIYARQNSSLLRLLFSFGLGLVGLALIVLSGFIYLHQATNAYSAQANDIEISLKEQKQKEVEKQAEDISSSLKLAVQVLSKEVLFSELIKRLAVITPSKVSLSNVSIAELGGAIDVAAEAIDYNAATQLQINLADPANKIFAKADIVSITCETDSPKKYPCKVVVRALFSKDNVFLFVNGKATGS